MRGMNIHGEGIYRNHCKIFNGTITRVFSPPLRIIAAEPFLVIPGTALFKIQGSS